jgi:CubicO group peptidase (beta-lactamase class C family)
MRRLLVLLAILATAHAAACAPAAKPPKTTSPATASTRPEAATPPKTTPPADPAATEAADLEARLAHLAGTLEAERERQHVPGMAVAVVRGDRVVFARGFGVRDLTTQEKVTPETLFAIGSSTKAFTATAVGMVVDDGKLSWDDPLSRHVPSLSLQVKAAPGEQATLRDALSHRTGFPRMSVLWASGTLSRDEVFQHASRAEPTAGLREKFQYNNVMYSGAGEASARAAGTTWDELVRTRILVPLGMERTYLTSHEAEKTGALATGYTWYEDENRHQRENLRDISSVAPAGSIHSSVADMTAWLRFQLGKGAFGGKRLMKEATLAETHKEQIPVPGLGGYGLGWFVRDWNGQPFVEHGGNIDGFSASVGLLPNSDIGYVYLSNTTASLLQSQVGPMVFEAMLGDAHRPGDAHTAGAEDYQPYLGVYIGSFGPFQEAPFRVFLEKGKLAVDVPQQGVFELTPPDDKGRRQFKAAPEVSVSFERDRDGKVVAMFVHQAGFDFELPRQGVEPTLHVDPAAVAPYVGKYQEQETAQKTVVTVLIHHGRLALDVPGQMRYALEPPTGPPGDPDADKWRLRVRREFYVTFQKGAGGKVQGLTVHQGDKAVVHTRLPDAGKEVAVTMESMTALRRPDQRKRALAGMGHAVMEGKIRFPNAGIEGTFTVHFEGPDRYRQEADLGKAGRMVQVANGQSAWVDSSFDQAEQLDGLRMMQARITHPLAFIGDWRALFDAVEILGTETVDGKVLHVVSLRAGGLPVWRAYVDPATGDVLRATGFEVAPFGNLPAASNFADYRQVRGVKGLRVPFQITTEVFQSGTMVVTIDRVRTGLRPDPALFPAELPTARNAGTPAASPGGQR